MAGNLDGWILGALASAAAWQAIGPNKQQQVIEALDRWVDEGQRKKQDEERQKVLAWIAQAMIPRRPQPAIPALATLDEPKLAAPLEPDARWRDVIVPPAVILILGKRGSGKSALAYRLLELFRHRLVPYVVGAPPQARKLLPDWIGIAPTLEDLPFNSIALIDEAYLAFHARGSMAAASKAMSQALNLSRQRNQTLIFVSQEARQVDRNIASSASVLVFKDLGMLQPEFDRPELKSLVRQARDAIAARSGDRRLWAYVYSPDADHLGLLKSQLPSFWKPSISRLFAQGSTSSASRPAKKMAPQDKAQRAMELRQEGHSYSQIAMRLGVSKSTVVNYLKGYPYRD